MHSTRRIIPAVVLVVGLLASCSGDDDTASPTTVAGGGPTTVTSVVAGGEEDDLCAIVSDATVESVLGGTPTYDRPATPGAPNQTCTWGIESGGTSVSAAMMVTAYPSEAEAAAALDAQVTDAQFSPKPYAGLADQAIAVDQPTARRVAARTGSTVVDVSALAVGRDLPALDLLVAMAREATGNL